MVPVVPSLPQHYAAGDGENLAEVCHARKSRGAVPARLGIPARRVRPREMLEEGETVRPQALLGLAAGLWFAFDGSLVGTGWLTWTPAAARARLARVARSRLRAAGPSRSGAVARNGSFSDLSVGDWLAAPDCASINHCRSVDMAQSES